MSAFEDIAKDPARYATFAQCIGDAKAPSRVIAAQEIEKAGCESVLDVGCGPGVFGDTLLMREWAGSYLGYEPNGTMARKARHAVQTMWPSDQFDAVLVRHVLEHLTPLAGSRLLAECRPRCRKLLLLAFSQELHNGSRAILTDKHLGAERYSHSRPMMLAELNRGFTVEMVPSEALVIREEMWICRGIGT